MSGSSVYVETSVISYLAAWPSRDVIVFGHQQTTHEWWASHRARFALHVSALVLREASGGDPQAVADRLSVVQGIPSLEIKPEAVALAQLLITEGSLPQKATADALHIAIAATHNINYLVTWNCRHIANAEMRPLIERVCRSRGYNPPALCTPEELMGGNPNVE
jgi:predicted nucleic acid-binding protein